MPHIDPADCSAATYRRRARMLRVAGRLASEAGDAAEARRCRLAAVIADAAADAELRKDKR